MTMNAALPRWTTTGTYDTGRQPAAAQYECSGCGDQLFDNSDTGPGLCDCAPRPAGPDAFAMWNTITAWAAGWYMHPWIGADTVDADDQPLGTLRVVAQITGGGHRISGVGDTPAAAVEELTRLLAEKFDDFPA